MNIQNTIISASHISVFQRDKAILRDVSLTITAQDFVTIIGPNGAGKSTLLKCLMGLLKPDTGIIEHKAGLRIGYVPQKIMPQASMPMRVSRFLQLRRRVSRADIAEIAHDVGIEGLLQQCLHELSGGELQRVLLARAILDNPELLVLDEPAQQLDITGQLAFYKLLERLYAKRALAIVMVSHDLHMVMASTQRVVCLFHHICCHGEPQAITQDPEFIALFGADMARMMAVYQHSHNHCHDEHLCDAPDHNHHHEHNHDQEQ